MDPGGLLTDHVSQQGQGGQPARLSGHALVHLVQEVLRDGDRVILSAMYTLHKKHIHLLHIQIILTHKKLSSK